MKIAENSDEIVMRHTPTSRWIFGGLLAFFFGAVYLSLAFSVIAGNGFGLLLAMAFVGALHFFIETYFFPMLLAPQTTVTVSRKFKSVNVLSRRIYGAKTERYFFHQIQKFKSHKVKGRFAAPYSLALILANGRTLKLKLPIAAADKNEAGKFIKKLNQFIKQPKL